jgi:hypothetical protein
LTYFFGNNSGEIELMGVSSSQDTEENPPAILGKVKLKDTPARDSLVCDLMEASRPKVVRLRI